MRQTSLWTDVLPPGPVTVLSADQQTVSLSVPLYPAGYMLQLDYSSGKHTGKLVMPDIVTVKVDGLNPGTEYTFSVRRIADDGRQSDASSQCVFTGNYEMQPHNLYNVFLTLHCVLFI